MSTYLVLKTLHVAALVVAFVGVGGLAAHAAAGGAKAENRMFGPLSAMHGAGLLVALLCGIGMLMLGGVGKPGSPTGVWAGAKLVLWMLLGASARLPYRGAPQAKWLLVLGLPLLAVVGVAIAVLKPF